MYDNWDNISFWHPDQVIKKKADEIIAMADELWNADFEEVDRLSKEIKRAAELIQRIELTLEEYRCRRCGCTCFCACYG